MGQDIEQVTFTRDDRQRYREKVKRCLEVFRQMLAEGRFEVGRKFVGVEMEFTVVDADGAPLNVNQALLDRLESDDFQTELAQFNIEFNLAPRKLIGTVFREIEEELSTSVEYAIRQAHDMGAYMAMIGIIPTLKDLNVAEQNMSANPRYHLLNEQILSARGEDLALVIEGPDETLELSANSIMVEAAATSVQLHLQVSPQGFPAVWNAAQAIAAVQVAMGANSPFFLGRELWRETRIAVFEQTIDTRTEELTAQGVRPRVWFGERWISSVMDLFDENVRYFPALLPRLDGEDPEAVLASGGIPHLPELSLHNGTVWRWNRPIYAVARGKPHLRVENRVLPSGPTLADVTANAAFWYGLVRAMVEREPPIDEELDFATAAANFRAASRDGIDARVTWPVFGEIDVTDLVLRELLPMAHVGLDRWGVDPDDRDHYLGIIEGRARQRVNGASWQVERFRALRNEGLDRDAALLETTRDYLHNMRRNVPVHRWEPGAHHADAG